MTAPAIEDGRTVLLDTMALISFLEGHERFGPVSEDILRRIERGGLKGVVSILVFAELLVPLYREGKDKTAAGLISRLSSFANLAVHDFDAGTAAMAARLRAEYGLRTPDAIHAASALLTGADGILTNDRQLRRLDDERLTVWLFDDLAAAP